jgi:predicted acyltransferase
MQTGQRLISLDVFRGLTMAGMVIVNNPGDWGNVYAPLLHAEWHGWTPTDLIFPFFLFIVGVSITLSRKAASGSSILRRAAIIFALGLFLAGYPRFDIGRWRIPGVLQRIAVCYLAAAATHAPGSSRPWPGYLRLATGPS